MTDQPIWRMVQELGSSVDWRDWDNDPITRKTGAVIRTGMGPLAPFDRAEASVTRRPLGWEVNLSLTAGGHTWSSIVLPGGAASNWPTLADAQQIVQRIAYDDGWEDHVCWETRQELEILPAQAVKSRAAGQ